MPEGSLSDPISGTRPGPTVGRRRGKHRMTSSSGVRRVGVMSTDEKPAGAASDEMKRKFKEALDKKNAQHRDGESHLDGESSIHGTHGAVTKREFRRKSG
ncbi:hypothetical protein GCM10025760_39170 [Microbacterium yannicii]|uniref:DUF5302 domain-containing protein n=2 Tax=Microbacteriaceae TaxID=85023 RepID=A0ABP9MV80_9MICO